MILFNVFELAQGLFFEEKVEPSVKQTLAKELVETVVEIKNYPSTENAVVADLLERWEIVYSVMGIDERIKGLLKVVRDGTRSAGWDNRCMAKIEFKGDGRNFLMARIVMDLDETFARMHESVESTESKADITEVVSDNPDLDTLNELTRTSDRQTKGVLHVLSGRVAPNLRPDTERNWRTVHRKDRGDWGV